MTTKSWSFGPSVSLPIFDGGSGAARVETARARYDQALASYRSKGSKVMFGMNAVGDTSGMVKVGALVTVLS